MRLGTIDREHLVEGLFASPRRNPCDFEPAATEGVSFSRGRECDHLGVVSLDLAEELAVDKATVSHHLKELEHAGLIERIRKGRRVYVRANRDAIESLRAFLDPRTHAKLDLESEACHCHG